MTFDELIAKSRVHAKGVAVSALTGSPFDDGGVFAEAMAEFCTANPEHPYTLARLKQVQQGPGIGSIHELGETAWCEAFDDFIEKTRANVLTVNPEATTFFPVFESLIHDEARVKELTARMSGYSKAIPYSNWLTALIPKHFARAHYQGDYCHQTKIARVFADHWRHYGKLVESSDIGVCTNLGGGDSIIGVKTVYNNQFGEVTIVRPRSLYHEYGHAFHNAIVSDKTAVNKLGEEVSMTLSETAAIFTEMMLYGGGIFPKRPERYARVGSPYPHFCCILGLCVSIEDDLFAGNIKAKDIATEWTSRWRDFTGVEYDEETDQKWFDDAHWGLGLIGYYRTYMLAILLAADMMMQLYDEDGGYLIEDINELTSVVVFPELEDLLSSISDSTTSIENIVFRGKTNDELLKNYMRYCSLAYRFY